MLCDNGFSDVAYKIMENTECPGWLYEVEKGVELLDDRIKVANHRIKDLERKGEEDGR